MQSAQQSYAVDVDPSLFDGTAAEMAPVKVDGVYIRFHMQLVENRLKSWGGVRVKPDGTEEKLEGEGRPIYDEVEYIEIVTPGDRTNIPNRPVTKRDRKQFAQQYAAWKAGVSQAATGTPIGAVVSPRRAKELEFFSVRTVEQYADVSDANIQNMGLGALAERQRCRDYLEASKGNAPVAALRSQLQAKENELDVLKRQVKELSERFDQSQKQKAKQG